MRKLPSDDLLTSVNSLNPRNYDQPSRSMVQDWQERLPKLMATKDWIVHPITRDVRKEMEAKVIAIKELLGSNPELTDVQRGSLFGEKAAYEYFLNLMKQNPDSEIATIAAGVRAEYES